MKFIPEGLFKEFTKYLPLTCIDIFIEFGEDGYLFIKRNIEPQKNEWAPIGGIIKFGESVEEACSRIARKEININIYNLKFIGYTQEVFKNRHCISLTFTATSRNRLISIDNKEISDYMISYKAPSELSNQYKKIYSKVIGL